MSYSSSLRGFMHLLCHCLDDEDLSRDREFSLKADLIDLRSSLFKSAHTHRDAYIIYNTL